jgi:hypothetical protein
VLAAAGEGKFGVVTRGSHLFEFGNHEAMKAKLSHLLDWLSQFLPGFPASK